jgi:hypothetical protein
MKLRGLVTNFHIHVTLGNLYITTIGPPILLQKIGEWKLGTRPRAFHFWEYIHKSDLFCIAG